MNPAWPCLYELQAQGCRAVLPREGKPTGVGWFLHGKPGAASPPQQGWPWLGGFMESTEPQCQWKAENC